MAVIPMVGNLSDRIGRKPPIIIGSLVSGVLSLDTYMPSALVTYLWLL